MKLSDFLRDRAAAYAIGIGAWGMALIFLFAFRVPLQAVIIVSVVVLLGAFVTEVRDFLRKKRWYDKLLHCLEEMDQKYLLPEMLDAPDFCDGQILREVMQETSRSMCEQVAVHRRESTEFREYIELWVHEIKLPVAGLTLMCHNDGNERYSEPLRRIDEYIENVLYYARSGSAGGDYIIKPVSLRRTFADIAVKNRAELQERGIALSAEGLGVNVMTDGKWLTFILGQLMGNSMKYGASEITVTAEDLPDRTVLHFRDNGAGIPESDLPYIFTKSFTGENGHTHGHSTGMGLYIVQKLCDKLGHAVEAESVQGEFTELRITFGKNDLHNVTDL